MADIVKTGNVIRCPRCGTWLMRGDYEGKAEVNCKNQRCNSALEVIITNGQPTVTVLANKKA